MRCYVTAISAKQRLVKLAPWKSAISYAHKESIAPPQPPKNYVPVEKQGVGYKVKNGRGGPVGPTGVAGSPHFKEMNGYTNGASRSPFDKIGPCLTCSLYTIMLFQCGC